VDWGSSEEIVAQGAKAPYYTPVGQYASTNGTGGVPDGAPVGEHAASQTLGAVALGGSINAPTQQNMPVGPNTPPGNPNAYSTMGQPSGPTQYMNQGDSTTAPLEMMNINPYGNQQGLPASGGQNPAVNPGTNPQLGGMGQVAAPGTGMYPGMDPSTAAMDPSLGMSNPYAQSNLGMGQSGSLMGITGDDDGGDYSAAGDMMGLGESAYGAGDGKITGSILQVDLQHGMLMIQSFTNPQPMRVLMGVGSSAPPDLLIPGKMVEITGRSTPNGFQATDIRAASGF
jgi:hypothetical protein